jgi:DNA-binding SARP family transcriptional activator
MLRALLAVLLLHLGDLRTADQLIDDLWGEPAPRSARASLHNLMSSLRRTIGHELLRSGRSGYVLEIREDQLDACRFEQLLVSSRSAHLGEKVRLLEAALGLWRGSPLLDVRYEAFAQAEIRRLEELHVCAREDLLTAKLALGGCEAVVPELQRLVDGFPFRERLRMQLMMALHRSGRSVEALVTYGDWRCLLMESWGMEPGQEIRQLCDDIVHAPALAGAGLR